MTNSEIDIQEAQSLLDEAEQTYNVDHQKSMTLAEKGLDICRSLNDRQSLARALNLVGQQVQTLGRLSDAQAFLEEGFQIRQELDDKIGIGVSLRNLGDIERWRGDFERAEILVRRALSIFNEHQDVQQLAQTAVRLHGVFVYGGKFEESVRLFENPGTLYQDFDLLERPDTPSIVSAFALMHLGRYKKAQERFQITVSTNPRTAIGYAIKNLGRIALVKGRADEAKTHLLEALSLFRETGDVNGLGQTLGCLSMMELQLGDLAQAQAYGDENWQIAAETLVILPSMTALASSALLRAEEGDVETALTLYMAASQAGHVANSVWYRDMIGKPINAAAKSLSPEVAARAIERGQEGTWRSTLQVQILN